jgi:probable F420-dependent oxidoreductase
MTQSNAAGRSIRVGVQLQPQHGTYQQFADAVRHAEEMGIDTIFDWDHFFPLYGDSQGNHFEGWTLLTAMATMTQRAEVGCLVTCNTYRNPALLSDMAKTVDHISNGRLILGIGAGWFERDYSEYGYDFGTAGSRLAALEQTLQVVKHRWEVDVPKPTRKIPILVGGGGEKKTLRITAKYADIWHSFGDPATYAHKVEVLNNWCAEEGRDPQEIEHAISPQGADAATLDAYVQAGASHFIIGLNAPWNLDGVARVLKWRSERQG